MERLQKAMERARAQRGEPSQTRSQPQATTAPATSPSVEQAWAELPAIELRKGVLRGGRIVTAQSAPEGAAFDLLRTRMLHQAKSHDWQRIAFVSPHSACGKTTTAANVAFSLARQTNLRTLVFDFDLRRRGLSQLLRQEPTHGMADVLEGRVSFAEHARRFGKNLAFGFSLGLTRTSSEILQSPQAAEVLDEIQSTYQPDLMLFDMPPLMASDDNFGFLQNVDAALILVAAEKTTMSQIDIAEREVAELTNVMGVVLNKCRYHKGAYAHEYNGYY